MDKYRIEELVENAVFAIYETSCLAYVICDSDLESTREFGKCVVSKIKEINFRVSRIRDCFGNPYYVGSPFPCSCEIRELDFNDPESIVDYVKRESRRDRCLILVAPNTKLPKYGDDGEISGIELNFFNKVRSKV